MNLDNYLLVCVYMCVAAFVYAGMYVNVCICVEGSKQAGMLFLRPFFENRAFLKNFQVC